MSRLQVQADSASCLWPSADTLCDLGHISNLRSEHAMLRTISSMLADDRDLDGTYPLSTDGGWVYQPSGNGPVLDCTLEIAGDLDAKEQSTTPFCLHGRHTLAPIGMPLRTVTSAPELIRVLYDAMRAHSAISERCRILHRDISENNILAVQRDDGSIHGVLIDFDSAVDVSAQRMAARPERTGTLSFMSIANLEKLPIERTVLDDWESLLYLICVISFYGVGNDATASFELGHPMLMWTEGEPSVIGHAKRGHLDTENTFMDDVLTHFKHQDGYEHLYDMAIDLYSCLFANEALKDIPNNVCHGARIKRIRVGTNKRGRAEYLYVDPFAERVNFASDIARDLLDVLARATETANSAD
ncbi:hypothetical protein H4R20_003832 [Coemansia guatemalensis]|uniref:Fungal-type protein kinase domain-containing protein n=1 Tax=Coemansia guatemalensis TaxID=2761395 RepID=A0A9W8HSK4_9FUNG|nr:hypothetical protein H4R20_003832 [Coemansia guatemalensis]